jgi:hypothetical protein
VQISPPPGDHKRACSHPRTMTVRSALKIATGRAAQTPARPRDPPRPSPGGPAPAAPAGTVGRLRPARPSPVWASAASILVVPTCFMTNAPAQAARRLSGAPWAARPGPGLARAVPAQATFSVTESTVLPTRRSSMPNVHGVPRLVDTATHHGSISAANDREPGGRAAGAQGLRHRFGQASSAAVTSRANLGVTAWWCQEPADRDDVWPPVLACQPHAVHDDQIPLVVVFDHVCANEQALHGPVSTPVACDKACDGDGAAGILVMAGSAERREWRASPSRVTVCPGPAGTSLALLS